MIIIWCLLFILLFLIILGKSADCFCTMHLKNLKDFKKMCYYHTKNRTITFIKYVVSYILFYMPEKITLILLFSITIFIKLDQLFIFFKLLSVINLFSAIMTWPSKKLTDYYCHKTDPYEETIQKMWKCPYIPFNVIFNYIKYNGYESLRQPEKLFENT